MPVLLPSLACRQTHGCVATFRLPSRNTQDLRAINLRSWPFSTEQSAKLFRLGISEQRLPLSRNLALAIDLSDCPKRLDPTLTAQPAPTYASRLLRNSQSIALYPTSTL